MGIIRDSGFEVPDDSTEEEEMNGFSEVCLSGNKHSLYEYVC